MGHIVEAADRGRDLPLQLIAPEGQPCQVGETANLSRNHAAQLVLGEVQVNSAAAVVGGHPIPVAERASLSQLSLRFQLAPSAAR